MGGSTQSHPNRGTRDAGHVARWRHDILHGAGLGVAALWPQPRSTQQQRENAACHRGITGGAAHKAYAQKTPWLTELLTQRKVEGIRVFRAPPKACYTLLVS